MSRGAPGAGPPGPLGALDRVVGALAFAGAALGAVVVLVTLACVAYSVVLRYVFATPVTWTDELSGYLVVAIVMLGAAESLRRGDHISVDLLTAGARGRTRLGLEVWAMVCAALVAGAIVYSAVLMVRFSYDFGIYSEGYLEMPMWIPQSVLLAGAALLGLAAIVRALALLGRARR